MKFLYLFVIVGLILVGCGDQPTGSQQFSESDPIKLGQTNNNDDADEQADTDEQASSDTTSATMIGTPGTDSDTFLAFLVANKHSVGLVSYTVDANGAVVTTDPLVEHNPTQPFSLASTVKIVIAAAYAIDVSEGRLDPNQMVPFKEWEAYYVPLTDGGAHEEALASFDIAIDDNGYAKDPQQQLNLQQLAQIMITYSDNASTDYLLHHVSQASIDRVVATMQQPEYPGGLLGLDLLLVNHEQGIIDEAGFNNLAELSDQERHTVIAQIEDRYLNTAWGTEERAWVAEGGDEPSYDFQRRFMQRFFPHGSAGDYARLMSQIQTETFLSPEISGLTNDILNWPMDDVDYQDSFQYYSTKGGSLAGIATSATSMWPLESQWNGASRVVILFLNDLTEAQAHMIEQNGLDEEFEQRLGTEPAFAQAVAEAFNR